jgi:hypothetical protein
MTIGRTFTQAACVLVEILRYLNIYSSVLLGLSFIKCRTIKLIKKFKSMF